MLWMWQLCRMSWLYCCSKVIATYTKFDLCCLQTSLGQLAQRLQLQRHPNVISMLEMCTVHPPASILFDRFRGVQNKVPLGLELSTNVKKRFFQDRLRSCAGEKWCCRKSGAQRQPFERGATWGCPEHPEAFHVATLPGLVALWSTEPPLRSHPEDIGTWAEAEMRPCQESRRWCFLWYFLNCLLSLLEIVPCSSMSTVETGLQRSETRSKTMWSILGGEKIASTHNQPMQCLGKWRALLNCFRTSFLVEGCWRGSCIWMGIRTNHIMWAYRAYPNICWGLDHFDFIPATGQQWHHLLPAAERLRGFAVKTWVGIWKMLLNVSTRVYPANCFSMFQAILTTIAYKCIQLLLMFNAPHLLLFVGMNPRQYPSAATKSCFQLLLRFWNVLTLSTEEHVAELLQDIWLMASTKHYSYGASASHPSRYGMIINSEWYRIAKLKASLHLFYFADSEVASCC